MNRKIYVVAAALAFAASTALAQGGGGGGGSGGAGQGGGSAGAGDQGAAAGSARGHADEAAAQQEAPSTRPTEGAGGKVPHPVAEGQQDDRQYGNTPPPAAREAGRLPDTGRAQGGTQQQAGATQTNEVTGRVALVNQNDREIAIDGGTTTTQVKIAPDAKITLDGKRASLQDLKPGASVRASLDRSGDEPMVKTLDVTSSKKK